VLCILQSSRQRLPLKCQYNSTRLHGVTSRKTDTFVVNASKTSNFRLTCRRKIRLVQERNINSKYCLNETNVIEPKAQNNYKIREPIAYSFTKHMLMFIGTSKFQIPADLSTEFQAVNLTEACKTSEECLAATSNSECFGKVCVCQPGYSNFGGSCRPGKFWLRGVY